MNINNDVLPNPSISEPGPTYSYPYICTNCRKGYDAKIPKGILLINKHECPNCGCDTGNPLHRTNNHFPPGAASLIDGLEEAARRAQQRQHSLYGNEPIGIGR